MDNDKTKLSIIEGEDRRSKDKWAEGFKEGFSTGHKLGYGQAVSDLLLDKGINADLLGESPKD